MQLNAAVDSAQLSAAFHFLFVCSAQLYATVCFVLAQLYAVIGSMEPNTVVHIIFIIDILFAQVNTAVTFIGIVTTKGYVQVNSLVR